MIEQSRQIVNEGATKAFTAFIPCKKKFYISSVVLGSLSCICYEPNIFDYSFIDLEIAILSFFAIYTDNKLNVFPFSQCLWS